jgi:hypothetical protein
MFYNIGHWADFVKLFTSVIYKRIKISYSVETGSSVQPSLERPGACPRVEHVKRLKSGSIRRLFRYSHLGNAPALQSDIRQGRKDFPGTKHSSFLGLLISGEKKSVITLTSEPNVINFLQFAIVQK